MTTVCPKCDHREIEGALFCSQCGANLNEEDGLSTARMRGITGPKLSPPPPPAITTDSVVSLHVVRTGQILPLVGRSEFTIGRISEGQSILPDIDLTPYEAYSQGVSRLHATIKISEEDQITIVDLGSANGTRINNVRLEPHKEHLLHHGDVVALGQFKIQTLVRQE